LPDEELANSDVSDLTASAAMHLREAGIGAGRFLGSTIWIAGERDASHAASDLTALLRVSPAQLKAGRMAQAAQAISAFLEKGKSLALAQPALPRLGEDDCQRCARQLSNYLRDARRELEALLERRPNTADAQLVEHAVVLFESWRVPETLGGTWLQYCDRFRPGMALAFVTEARQAAQSLRRGEASQPVIRASAEIANRSPSVAQDTPVASMLKRFAVGMVGGLATYGSLLLAPEAIAALAVPATAIAAMLGYAGGPAVLRGLGFGPRNSGSSRKSASGSASCAASLEGWETLERRLAVWFHDHFRPGEASLATEWDRLADRLNEVAPREGEPADGR